MAAFNSGGGVEAAGLATSAIKLGYAAITADINTVSTTAVLATGLSTTVTIPSGGRSVKITFYCGGVYNTVASQSIASIWEGTVGSGTRLANGNNGNGAGQIVPFTLMAVVTPAAGSKTYNVGFNSASSGTTYFVAGATYPAFILVEAI